MNGKILIIKTGASGDVIRTSVLLHILSGDITWVTAEYNKILLPQHHPSLKKIVSLQEADELKEETFDSVISLDDDTECLEFASSLKTKDFIGAHLNSGSRTYTKHLEEWFDMSLISRFGIRQADALKWKNRKSFQELLFNGFNESYGMQHTYLINENVQTSRIKGKIGLEARAGGRWPTKTWNKFNILADELTAMNFTPCFFEQRQNIMDYLNDIGTCSAVITGDSLAMHVALALKIPVVAIFTCTSPWEIFDYGLMEKVISPQLENAFYKTTYVAEAVDSISVADVMNAFRKVMKC